MEVLSLAVELRKRERVSSAAACTKAWRIQNEYPDQLRRAAEAWAENSKIPPVEVANLTLEKVMQQARISVPEALEILYIIHKDEAAGKTLLMRCTPKD